MQPCSIAHACGTASFRDRGDVHSPNNGEDNWIHQFILAHAPKPSVPQPHLLFSHLVAHSSLVSAWWGEQLSFPTRQCVTEAQCNKPTACNLCIVQTWKYGLYLVYNWKPLHTLQSFHLFPCAFPVPLPWTRSNLNCLPLIAPLFCGLQKHLMKKRDTKHELKHIPEFRPKNIGFMHCLLYPFILDACNSPILSTHCLPSGDWTGSQNSAFTSSTLAPLWNSNNLINEWEVPLEERQRQPEQRIVIL